MRSFWFDPYLWVHLAGIAALPLFLELCLLGLSIGEPLFPAWFELLFVGAIGILPVLWMQWQRPFSIFSLVLLALKPSQLTDDQRRILQRFKTPLHRILAVLSALVMVGMLWQLYQIAPSVSPPLFANISRGAALVIAAIAFLGSNLFLQVPVSVLSVLLTRDNTFATTPPYEAERIAQSFTIPGIRVGKILPPLLRSLPPTPTAPPPDPIARSAPPASPPSAAPNLEASAAPPVPPPFSPPAELTQLAESSELIEEIIVPSIIVSPTPPTASVERATSLEILPEAIEPEPDAAVIDAERMQPAKNLSDTRTIPHSIDSPPTPSVEIVEDATVVEIFQTDNADDHADDQNKDDRQPETNPEISKSDTDEKKPQQETEPSDLWE